jgi:putative ABC transport system ATP-binding protein
LEIYLLPGHFSSDIMVTPLIEIFNLQKHYQMGNYTVRALDGIDLTIKENTFTVVMGPSGSGKSTLLYLLGGLDRPTQGRILVNGQEINALDENALAIYRRRTVGFIFQSFNLVQSFSALDNVSFPLRFAKISRRQRNQQGEELLNRVGLSDRAHHNPTELSGGQQQRVAIARALVNDPKIILADEPTGNLDTASGSSIMRVLSDLHQSGRTIMVVTHDQRMKSFATHVLYLLDGKIVSEADYNAALIMAAST